MDYLTEVFDATWTAKVRASLLPHQGDAVFLPFYFLFASLKKGTFRKRMDSYFLNILRNISGHVHDNWGSTRKVYHFGNNTGLLLASRNLLFMVHFLWVLVVLCEVSSRKYIVSILTRMWNYPIINGPYLTKDLTSPTSLQLPKVVKLNEWRPSVVRILTDKWIPVAAFSTNMGHDNLLSSKILQYYLRGILRAVVEM